MKVSCYMTWNFFGIPVYIKVSCYSTHNFLQCKTPRVVYTVAEGLAPDRCCNLGSPMEAYRQKRQAFALVAWSWWRAQQGAGHNNLFRNEHVSGIFAMQLNASSSQIVHILNSNKAFCTGFVCFLHPANFNIAITYFETRRCNYTEKNCVLCSRVLSIAWNAKYVSARERFAFIMLQSFKLLDMKIWRSWRHT
jgi:hypothetical protein